MALRICRLSGRAVTSCLTMTAALHDALRHVLVRRQFDVCRYWVTERDRAGVVEGKFECQVFHQCAGDRPAIPVFRRAEWRVVGTSIILRAAAARRAIEKPWNGKQGRGARQEG